mmetsp:Transcript_14135/g.40039  ORF Transcript_14135/g.40039 Transcript_14135/m.40039 type:complete len:427 (+) Transcript_14135:1580-2860(+)
MDPVGHLLDDALGDPHDVPDLLLFHLDVSPEHSVVELLGEALLAKPQLVVREELVDGLVVVRARDAQNLVVRRKLREHLKHLVRILGGRQVLLPVRIKRSEVAVQAPLVIPSELGAHAVEGNRDGPPVRLEGQECGHHLPRRSPHLGAKRVKVLDPALVQHVSHDLQVHLGEVLPRQTALEVLGEGRVDQHQLVELLHVRGHRQRSDGIKHAEGVALVQQLRRVLVVEAARYDEHDVVDHMGYPAHLKKRIQGTLRLALEVLELLHELFRARFHQRRRRVPALHLPRQVPVPRCGEVHLHVVQILALAKQSVIPGAQQGSLIPPNDGLRVPIPQVERSHLHPVPPLSSQADTTPHQSLSLFLAPKGRNASNQGINRKASVRSFACHPPPPLRPAPFVQRRRFAFQSSVCRNPPPNTRETENGIEGS